MPNRKIEPRLEEEIQRVEAAAEPDRKIPVTIEHIKEVQARPGEDRGAQLDELEREVRDLQRGIVMRLSDLGIVGGIHQATLSNSLSVSLTPAQIREIAARDDVNFIRLGREEQVTA